MVARTAGGREVAGSNPVAPTLKPLDLQGVFNFMCTPESAHTKAGREPPLPHPGEKKNY